MTFTAYDADGNPITGGDPSQDEPDTDTDRPVQQRDRPDPPPATDGADLTELLAGEA